MTTEIDAPPRLVLVTPDAEHKIFHDWLSSDKGMDRVHTLRSRQELMTKRLGRSGYNKKAYALVTENMGVLSVIYTHWSNPQGTKNSWDILPGNIDKILDEPSHPLDEEASVVTCYSISSFADKSGKPLIKAIYHEFRQVANPPVITTLSPLRTLQQWMTENELVLSGSEEARLATVARYLKMKKDPVQRFHLGNGAQVGAIHFNASAVGKPDAVLGAGVMISYRYPRDENRLGENIEISKRPNSVPSSYHLQALLR